MATIAEAQEYPDHIAVMKHLGGYYAVYMKFNRHFERYDVKAYVSPRRVSEEEAQREAVDYANTAKMEIRL